MSAEAERIMREALEHLATPNYRVKPNGQDALNMAAYAKETLEAVERLQEKAKGG